MAYIVVTKERPDGDAQLLERVAPEDFHADHFRTCLSDRLAWAVEDAEREPPALPEEEPPRDAPAHVLVHA